MKTVLYSTLSLLAFAGNSVLCRLALGSEGIDAVSFTIVRLLSGACALALIIKLSSTVSASRGSWMAALMLFLYALSFSFAYLQLNTGAGAIILFGVVQIIMIALSYKQKKALCVYEWIGLLIAMSGLIYFLAPSFGSPSFRGVVLIGLSGVAWAFYTILGKASADPISDTAHNFIKTLPMLALLLLVAYKFMHFEMYAFWLAVASGALASGLGYTLWYFALRTLSNVQAGSLQLLVPILASLGGLGFIGEALTWHLCLSSFVILGGVLIVLRGNTLLNFVSFSKRNST